MNADASSTTILMRSDAAARPDRAAQEAVRAATAGIQAPADAGESRRFGAVLAALAQRDGLLAAIQLGGGSSQGGPFRLLPCLLAATRALAALDDAGMAVAGREELLRAVRGQVRQALERLVSAPPTGWVVAACPEAATDAHVAALALNRMGRPLHPWPQDGLPRRGRFIAIGRAGDAQALARHPRCDGVTTTAAVCDSLARLHRCA